MALLQPISYYHGAASMIQGQAEPLVRELLAEITSMQSEALKAAKDQSELEERLAMASRIADETVAETFGQRHYMGNRKKQFQELPKDMKAWLNMSPTARAMIGGITVENDGTLKIDEDWKQVE